MKKYLILIAAVGLLGVAFIGWRIFSPWNTSTISDITIPGSQAVHNTPLSLASLPASGGIVLDPGNAPELDHLGLGRSMPDKDPPSIPFSKYGMYWSDRFSVVEGDTLQVTVASDAPVSWFGVDWSDLDVRGTLAETKTDEDGRSFDPIYPDYSSKETGPNSYKLIIDYKVRYDADYVLVVKNQSPLDSPSLSLAASLKPNISAKRILKSIPIINKLSTTDDDD